MDIYHVTLASDGRRPLFPDEQVRRSAVRALARVGASVLVLFNLVDDHLHAVVAAARAASGRFAQALNLSLQHVAGVPLESARVRPVKDRSHLRWLVRYVLRQGPHHGLPGHPGLWSGSCFQDLVGARYLPGLQMVTRRALPRFRLREAFESVGLTSDPLQPASGEAIFAAGATRLVEAALAATCPVSLQGSQPAAVAARVTVFSLGAEAGLAEQDIARALAIPSRTARRLARREPCEPLASAIRTRLALEERVAATRWSVSS